MPYFKMKYIVSAAGQVDGFEDEDDDDDDEDGDGDVDDDGDGDDDEEEEEEDDDGPGLEYLDKENMTVSFQIFIMLRLNIEMT